MSHRSQNAAATHLRLRDIPTSVKHAPIGSQAATPSHTGELFTTPVLYINRKSEGDRRTWIEAGLRKAGIEAERITAVEGLDVPRPLAHLFLDGDTQCSAMSPAEIGCYASHLMAARLVVKRGSDYAMILEDDATVPPNLAESLQDILTNLPAGWDFVHLYGQEPFATKPVARLEQSRTLVRYSRVPRGTVAYLISRSGAEKFLKPSKRFWPIDTDIRQPWRFGLQIYGVVPALVDQSGQFPSAIAAGAKGERSRLRRGLPIPSRQCWTGNPLHTPQGFYFNLKTLGPLWWARCCYQNVRRRVVGWSRG
jgi:glycosyl transferase family 25